MDPYEVFFYITAGIYGLIMIVLFVDGGRHYGNR